VTPQSATGGDALSTVREATFDLWRKHGMTTMFGNPGSTELPMLADFPDDFTYVLGLQEAVAVGMADGFAQASGTVGHVNLHTAPGVGNGMGAIFNAQANHTPLLVTAGQQVRPVMTMQANLTNRDATRMPHPLVKWSFEPSRAEDVPAAIGRAIHTAAIAPKGPTFVSIPMDDWTAEAPADATDHAIARTISARAGADPDAVAQLAERLAAASNPVLVAGPDIDASGAWDDAVALAESQRMAVWAIPPTGGGRLGFPEDHPLFQGSLPPAIAPVAEMLAPYDLVIVAGAGVFAYYPYIAGDLLPEGAALVAITSDPEEAARAPMGEAIVGDVALTLSALRTALGDGEAGRDAPPERDGPLDAPDLGPDSAMSGTEAMKVLGSVFPEDGIVVLEAPSSTLALRNQLRLNKPGSYYFGAGGGLGFGLSAAVGVQLAQPERPVVCVVGEGSAQYAITAFWSAVAYNAPVTFLVLRNSEYAILKWFSLAEGVENAPGLDLPALDVAAVAEGYGVPSKRAEGGDELEAALSESLGTSGPSLVEVGIAPGMWLG
jgi:benzoylformate decarboxylase